MSNIREVVARNISALRKNKKMTQIELAEKVNYSDKAVSRWESGEVSLDIETLDRVATALGVTLTKLFDENLDIQQTLKEDKQKRINKLIISLLAITFIWTMATIIYVYSMLIDARDNWVIFIYSFPLTFMTGIIFNTIWGVRRYNYPLASILVWSTLASIYIGTLKYNMWPIFILGAPLQIVIILWSKLHS